MRNRLTKLSTLLTYMAQTASSRMLQICILLVGLDQNDWMYEQGLGQLRSYPC